MELTLKPDCSWAIAYINRDFIYRVEKDLSKNKSYEGIKAYIPTIRILRKQFKGRDIFEEIPLLFNYGFFQIPNSKLEVEFLRKMKEDILAIHAWVKDTKEIIRVKPSLITGSEPLVRRDIIPVALATSGEINRLVDAHKRLSIFGKDDIDNLKIGTIITLKGYPFDGMNAVVKSINIKKEEVGVELLLESIIKNVTVSFDNVFYTVYHKAFDENDFREKSLEEIALKGKNAAQKYMGYDQQQ
jgi:hypothetical protein